MGGFDRARRRVLPMLLVLATIAAGACREVEEPSGEDYCGGDYGCVRLAAGEPLVIGTLLDESGPQAEVGLDSRNGVLLAADHVDGSFDGVPGELLGHEILFQHEDERCNVEGGKNGARELVDRRNDLDVVAAIGTTCAAGGLGVADQILSDEGVPMLSPSVATPEMTDPEQRAAFFFRFAHNGYAESFELARFASEALGARTTAVVEEDNFDLESGGRFADAFVAALGEIRPRVTVAHDDPNLRKTIEDSLDRPGPALDAVFLSVSSDRIVAIARAVNAALPRAHLLTARWPLDQTSLGDLAFAGVYMPEPARPIGDRFYERRFLPAYRDLFGTPSSSYHANAFDATTVLFRAIEAVAIRDGDTLFIPRTALREAIAMTRDFDGLSGLLTCDEHGDCQPDTAFVIGQARSESAD